MFLIADRLMSGSRTFAGFTRPRYDQPGTTLWYHTLDVGPATPSTDIYRGKVVLLADERTQSHAEFTMMALRMAPDVAIVGSTTSGADGDVSPIVLPGGIRTFFSGLGVFYPDHRPTQRVGIVPDVVVRPTVAGIRSGTDEVLEKALERFKN
jgi:C-terminal processing protease CtpA/Prc